LLTGGQKYLRSNNEDNSLFESVLKYKSMSKKLSMIQSNLKETKKQLESVQESQAKAQLRLDLKLRLDKWKNERIEYETRLEQVKSDIESSKKELKQFKFLHKRKDLTQKHLNKLWEKQSLDSLDVEREKSKALEQKKQLETKFDELQVS
jgi:chromosome segregation ATPase